VDVGHRLEDSAENWARLGFPEASRVDDELEKLAASAELEKNKVEVGIEEEIDQLDNPGMRQLLMDPDFGLKAVLKVALSEARALEYFASVIAICRGVVREFDNAEFAFANRAPEFVGADLLWNLMA
jgi:hypothetical protein